MKIKGITIWEQHCEKFVLGIAVLVAGFFTVKQFIGDPNAVEIGGAMVSPSDVDNVLEDEAKKLKASLERTEVMAGATDTGESVKLNELELDRTLARFDRGINAAVSPAPRLVMLEQEVPVQIGATSIVAVTSYHMPNLAPPSKVLADVRTDTIKDEAIEAHPDLAGMLPNPLGPYDKTWVTFGARIDLIAQREEYNKGSADADPGESQKLPSSWIEKLVLVVEAEREEWDGAEWTNLQVVNPIPGALSIQEEVDAGEFTRQDKNDLIGYIGDPVSQRGILQPDFYETVNGYDDPLDLDPPVVGDADDPEAEVDEERRTLEDGLKYYLKQLQGKRRRLAIVEAKLEESDCDNIDDDDDGGSDGGGGGGGRSGGGAGVGAGAGAMSRDGGNDLADRKRECKKLARQKKQIANVINSIEKKVAVLEEELAIDVDLDQPEEEDPVGFAEGDTLDMWAYDLKVEPGKTYRYRMRYRMYNPFFGQQLSLLEEQTPLADRIDITSAASEWSEGITVPRPVEHFATSVRARGGNLQLGQASLSVFRYFDGQWRKETFTVQPGDIIGGLKRPRRRSGEEQKPEVDYTTDWFVLEIIEDVHGGDSVIVLQNLVTGEIEHRSATSDTRSAEYRTLREAAEEQRVASAQ